MKKSTLFGMVLCVTLASCNYASGSNITIGPLGINSLGLRFGDAGFELTGAGITIGQVEHGRAAKPGFDSAPNSNSFVIPHAVYIVNQEATVPNTHIVDENDFPHATAVASVMIGRDDTDNSLPPNGSWPRGVAPFAVLHSAAFDPDYPSSNFDDETLIILTTQHIAAIANMRSINHSWGGNVSVPNGNSQVTLGIDWLAREKDVLMVLCGAYVGRDFRVPSDSFNGMTVSMSSYVSPVEVAVASQNLFHSGVDASGERTSVALLAPGVGVEASILGDGEAIVTGCSFAAPHVTGTVALLQEGAEYNIATGQPRWISGNSRRHQVMKAVLMNSSDKIFDDGDFYLPGSSTPVKRGHFLGMDKIVYMQDSFDTFVNSNAYSDEFIPLDIQMGTGHLNAKRALQQFRNGEYNSFSDPIPMIGWDYGLSVAAGYENRYQFNKPLQGDSFISITLAFDRVVNFDLDVNMNGKYDDGDRFEEYIWMDNPHPYADDVISDLDIFLVERGDPWTAAIAESISPDSTVDHIFFQIPETGNYDIIVRQWDNDAGPVNYGLAWWALSAAGDFNEDAKWDCTDIDMLTAAIVNVSSSPIYDLNGDSFINLNDITDKASGWLTIAGAHDSNASPGGHGNTSGLPYLPGDGNLDGNVDGTDFGIWNASKFQDPPPQGWCAGDWNADGNVDGSDFGVWNANKFTGSQTASVPEPSLAAMMTALAMVTMGSRRRS